MESPYHYVPLLNPRSIRIIHLTPSVEFESPLYCRLVAVSLDEYPEYNADYTALSYSWDSQTPSSRVDSDNGTLLITPNCESALRRLRDAEEIQTLWIDSICINQSPDAVDERNQQVTLMGEIYRNARRVVVWVGECDERAELAIKKIGEIVDRVEGNTLENRREIQREVRDRVRRIASEVSQASDDLIGPLFERSWFHRMWTIQEVTLSQVDKIELHCETIVLPWKYILLAVDGLRTAKYRWGRWGEAMKLLLQLTIYLISKRYTGAKEVLDDNPGDIHNDPLAFSILINAREKNSTDPKDKIFALHGVLKELGVPFPAPDYRKTVEQIFRESVIATISYDKNLYCLYHAPSDHRRAGLASWVPDWSDAGWAESDPRYGLLRDRFAACGPANAKWRFSYNQKQLILTAKIVDTLIYRTNPLLIAEDIWRSSIDGTLLQQLQGPGRQNFMQFYYSTYSILKTWIEVSQWSDCHNGESSKEALQRTLVSDNPACNADASRGGAFEHWYNVMTAGDLEITEIALTKSQPRQLLPTAPAEREAFLRACMAQIPEFQRSFTAMQSGPGLSFHFRAVAFSQKKCFFYTEKGHLGTVADPLPTPAEAGDVIAVVAGLEMPLLLRPVESGYRLIAHVYVHGIMFGEAWPEQEGELEEIALI